MFIYNAGKQYKYKYSPCRLLQHSYRDENGVSRKRTILNLTKLPPAIASAIERVVKENDTGKTPVLLENVLQSNNKSLGEVTVLKRLSDRVGITKILDKHLGKQIRTLILAMTINRISSPKSRYSLKTWLKTTYLPETLRTPLKEFHHNKLYSALELLSQRQSDIEVSLWKQTQKKEPNLRLMLYDITSTYLEGEYQDLKLAAYGYSRDKKRGKKQLVIALVATPTGRPVCVEVLPGNPADKTTLTNKINDLKTRFHISQVIYVFDRGMKDKQKLATLRAKDTAYITALNRGEIQKLILQTDNQNSPIQLGLFDQEIAEYETGMGRDYQRYIICQSQVVAKNSKQRQQLRQKTEAKLIAIQKSIKNKQLKDSLKIAARVEKWLSKWKMKKYYRVKIKTGYFHWEQDEEKIRLAEQLDQIFVLETTTRKEQLTKDKVRQSYQNLITIENNFKTIKSALKVRPVHLQKEATVRGHVFICFLALYLKKELEIELRPLLKETWEKEKKQGRGEGEPLGKSLNVKQKQKTAKTNKTKTVSTSTVKYKHTFDDLLTQLKEIRQSKLIAGQHHTWVMNQLSGIQKQILKTLKMRIQTIDPLPSALL